MDHFRCACRRAIHVRIGPCGDRCRVAGDEHFAAAVINDETNIEQTKGTTTLADFDDSVSVFDDVNNTGNATVSQTSKLTIAGGQLTGFSVQGDGVGIGDGWTPPGCSISSSTSRRPAFTSRPPAASAAAGRPAGRSSRSCPRWWVRPKPIISEMPADADVNFGKNGTLAPGRYDVARRVRRRRPRRLRVPGRTSHSASARPPCRSRCRRAVWEARRCSPPVSSGYVVRRGRRS